VRRGWETWAARLARAVERQVDDVRGRVQEARAARQVIAYRGFGNAREWYVSGRVLANRPVDPAHAGHTWWRNLAATFRHLDSDEIAGAHVRIGAGSVTREAITDEEGFFRAWLTPGDAGAEQLWNPVDVEVTDRLAEDAGPVRATAHVLVPRSTAAFGVISDMDDTVIRTDATRLVQMIRRTLLENALTRLPFDGVAEFYRALHDGSVGHAGNPVFYVSSSPWNLYPVLTEFLEVQRIPLGPLMLRDWGISERGVLPTRHGEHKLGAIRQIFDCYPTLPFILIGDSGQEDPEIYREIVHGYRGRVLAVYIRNVTPYPMRVDAISRLAEEVRQAGSELLLSDDTLAAARHAAERGWVHSESIEEIERAVSSAAARPD
jgi:phosphatidate phosphatase APP1